MCYIDMEPADLWSEITRKARTAKMCGACHGTIVPTSHYVKHFSKFDGYVTSELLCKACESDRKVFADAHGGMLANPAAFRDLLQDCVSEDDNDQWKEMLDRMRTRAAVTEQRMVTP